jgi:protein-S-isoprenylcysteine O-methyltransferase Ste14
MHVFLHWSKKEQPLLLRLGAGLLAGGLFAALIPWSLLFGLPRLDGRLGLPLIHLGPAGTIVGGILILAGLPLAFWTVVDQFTRASGTPLPMLPTQKLLTDGPYAWSRNPMVFGTLCAYLGLAVIAASWSSLALVLLFGGLLLLYLKLVEERELAARFGQAYLDYKSRTAFLIPWPRRRS